MGLGQGGINLKDRFNPIDQMFYIPVKYFILDLIDDRRQIFDGEINIFLLFRAREREKA